MLFYLLLHHGTVVAINVNWVDEFQGLKHSISSTVKSRVVDCLGYVSSTPKDFQVDNEV